MVYYKLIAIKIDDFCSSIFYEDNYALSDIIIAEKQKSELEKNGLICLLVRTVSNIRI